MSTPWTMSNGSAPLRRAAISQEMSPSDPSGPGSRTYSALTRPAFDRRAERRQVGRRVVALADGEPQIARAVDVRRVGRRYLELRRRRLRLLPARPRDRDRAEPVVPQQSLDELLEDEQLLGGRVGGDQEPDAAVWTASRFVQTVAQLRLHVMPRGGLERSAGAHHRAAQARIALDPVIVEAADVAHPVAVDVRRCTAASCESAATPSPIRAWP